MTTWGNQHVSRKMELLTLLHLARDVLDGGFVLTARDLLGIWKAKMRSVPASTRRRWRCGR